MKQNSLPRLLGYSVINPSRNNKPDKPYRQYYVVRYHTNVEFCVIINEIPTILRPVWPLHELFDKNDGNSKFVPCIRESIETL